MSLTFWTWQLSSTWTQLLLGRMEFHNHSQNNATPPTAPTSLLQIPTLHVAFMVQCRMPDLQMLILRMTWQSASGLLQPGVITIGRLTMFPLIPAQHQQRRISLIPQTFWGVNYFPEDQKDQTPHKTGKIENQLVSKRPDPCCVWASCLKHPPVLPPPPSVNLWLSTAPTALTRISTTFSVCVHCNCVCCCAPRCSKCTTVRKWCSFFLVLGHHKNENDVIG